MSEFKLGSRLWCWGGGMKSRRGVWGTTSIDLGTEYKPVRGQGARVWYLL